MEIIEEQENVLKTANECAENCKSSINDLFQYLLDSAEKHFEKEITGSHMFYFMMKINDYFLIRQGNFFKYLFNSNSITSEEKELMIDLITDRMKKAFLMSINQGEKNGNE